MKNSSSAMATKRGSAPSLTLRSSKKQSGGTVSTLISRRKDTGQTTPWRTTFSTRLSMASYPLPSQNVPAPSALTQDAPNPRNTLPQIPRTHDPTNDNLPPHHTRMSQNADSLHPSTFRQAPSRPKPPRPFHQPPKLRYPTPPPPQLPML